MNNVEKNINEVLECINKFWELLPTEQQTIQLAKLVGRAEGILDHVKELTKDCNKN